ncbi:FAD-binding oxidoreductase [Novosphingobium sp. 1949]|uniref:FAD-binding oxidoreductase n=1 Tax=Novosphingobium organovorum TaxID=2930092 RepID=A0ABT0BC96_9SPHN|nr:FAD-binding oxidoreductase [Novosphingobium organovorum]MCJ2182603.1 FAD-binding oxidoreductase [Novosphingobium organovorum]
MRSPDLFLDHAHTLLGRRGLTRDAQDLAPWSTDWRGRFHGRPLALAAPPDTATLSALVALCHEHRIALVPQGGNSGMSGGATPDASGAQLLLSLRRMNAIRTLDLAERRVTCEAGVILQTLHEAAEAQGLRFPLTLGGKGSATVGGLIATNAGGTQVLRHGTMRALVLGIEAVLADGRIYSALTPLRKDNRGFDLKQLFIGAEGVNGIVTAATLQLVPAVAERVVAWVGVTSLTQARHLLQACEDALGPGVEGFEVLPQSCLDHVLEHLPGSRAPLADRHAWHALIEFARPATASSAHETPPTPLRDAVEQALATALEDGLIEDAVLAASETQAEAFWRLRESISPAERARGPAVQHDISVPVESMPAFIAQAAPQLEREWPGTHALAFGHLGDGNVHFHVVAPPGVAPEAWYANDAKAISRRVHDLVTEWGGSISAEHGIGQLKRDELARLGDPVALDLLRAVKHALDPLGLLNPGKLL